MKFQASKFQTRLFKVLAFLLVMAITFPLLNEVNVNGESFNSGNLSDWRELDMQGKPYVDKLIKLRPRVYRYDDLYKSQADKVFNNGMGCLAFVKFLVDEKTVLVNDTLADKKDIEILKSNFPEWQIEFVSLGYPDWYFIKNLKSCRGK